MWDDDFAIEVRNMPVPVKFFTGGRLEFIEISLINFYGLCVRSKSGEWVVAWIDEVGENGKFILYNNRLKELTLQGFVARPKKCAVSDNGVFSVEDWKSPQVLSGVFYVFTPTGQSLIKRNFEANIYNSGISKNGLFAICQTANNSSDDGNKLTFFDLNSKCEVFSITPKTKWATDYKFYEEVEEFAVVIKDLGEFRYGFSGEFLDTEKYTVACLSNECFTDVLASVEERLSGEIEPQDVASILELIEKARKLGANKYPAWEAVVFKLQGLAYLVTGDKKLALKSFDSALSINPESPRLFRRRFNLSHAT